MTESAFVAWLPGADRTIAEISGASATVMVALAVLAENAVDPPLVVVSTPVSPAEPLVWSQARTVTDPPASPLKSAVGTNRRRSSSASKSAASSAGETLLTGLQVFPPSVEYSQVPSVSSTPVTATPSVSPSASPVMPAESSITDTGVPLLSVASSSMLFSKRVSVDSIGALFASTLLKKVGSFVSTVKARSRSELSLRLALVPS